MLPRSKWAIGYLCISVSYGLLKGDWPVWQMPKFLQGRRRVDTYNAVGARKHEHRQRMVNHRLVKGWQNLLAGHTREWIEGARIISATLCL